MKPEGRKLSILKVIIDDYIHTGQPVGSRTVSKKPTIAVSSATVRNEMADLEELGYLLQPHTSAGRIPSDIGYRLYVDLIDEEFQIGEREQDLIKTILFVKSCEVEDIVKQALKIITQMTGLPTVISLPLFKKSTLQNMKLIKVNDNRVLLILVSDTGVVKNISLPIIGAEQSALDAIAGALLEKFNNTTIGQISVKEVNKLKTELKEYTKIIDYLIPILRDSLKEISEVELYVDGINHIFELNEFSELSRARQFLELISNEGLLYEALNEAKDGIKVSIGRENKLPQLHHLSMIAAPYKFNGLNDGRIGVIGPTRMAYDRVISTVKFAADTLSSLFSGIDL